MPCVLTWFLITYRCVVRMRVSSGIRWKEEVGCIAFCHVYLLRYYQRSPTMAGHSYYARPNNHWTSFVIAEEPSQTDSFSQAENLCLRKLSLYSSIILAVDMLPIRCLEQHLKDFISKLAKRASGACMQWSRKETGGQFSWILTKNSQPGLQYARTVCFSNWDNA